jgi:hypothetical protein
LYLLKSIKSLATAETSADAFSFGHTTALLDRITTHLGGRHER